MRAATRSSSIKHTKNSRDDVQNAIFQLVTQIDRALRQVERVRPPYPVTCADASLFISSLRRLRAQLRLGSGLWADAWGRGATETRWIWRDHACVVSTQQTRGRGLALACWPSSDGSTILGAGKPHPRRRGVVGGFLSVWSVRAEGQLQLVLAGAALAETAST
jgi:hypothetical protein